MSSKYRNGTYSHEMITMNEHKSLMEDQRIHYENMISSLQKELTKCRQKLIENGIERTPTPNITLTVDSDTRGDDHATYNLHRQLSKNSNSNRRKSSMILQNMVSIDEDIEDDLSEDETIPVIERRITKNQLAHNRRVTSMIIEDLIGVDDDDDDDDNVDNLGSDDDDDDTDTTSDESQENDNLAAIVLEQQLLAAQYQDINDVDKLKEIIETLQNELKQSRINTVSRDHDVNNLKEETIDLESQLVNERNETEKYKHLYSISRNMEADIIQRVNDTYNHDDDNDNDNYEELERIRKSKLDLVMNLCLELDKMREIIKQQQAQIDIFNKQ